MIVIVIQHHGTPHQRVSSVQEPAAECALEAVELCVAALRGSGFGDDSLAHAMRVLVQEADNNAAAAEDDDETLQE